MLALAGCSSCPLEGVFVGNLRVPKGAMLGSLGKTRGPRFSIRQTSKQHLLHPNPLFYVRHSPLPGTLEHLICLRTLIFIRDF